VLTANQVIIGWAQAEGLLNDSLSREQFREILRKQYYSDETNNRRAGAAAGHMWRFIREMKPQDRIVVPRGPDFYVAEVIGPATPHMSGQRSPRTLHTVGR
jgi:predicted Mrr-cat superfamily restriction endonuclease